MVIKWVRKSLIYNTFCTDRLPSNVYNVRGEIVTQGEDQLNDLVVN